MDDFINKLISRRGMLKCSKNSLGTLFVISQATGIPIPLLLKIDQAQAIEPIETKMFVVVQNRSAIRSNDFNHSAEAQPAMLDKNWNDDQRITVEHGDSTSLMPPGIGNLSQFGDRLTALVGVDTQNNGHEAGNRNATSNAITGVAANSMHVIVGGASASVIRNVNFGATNTYTNGANSGGTSPQQFLNSLETPPGPSEQIVTRLEQFRNSFHKEVTKKLPTGDQKTIERYWESNGSFHLAKERAEALFTNAAPANSVAGQLEMARRIFNAGLANAFTISGGGNFDTHGGNGPQVRLAEAMSNNIAEFLTNMQNSDQIDMVNVMITSAFGRNPIFNGNAGTDHLPSNGHVTLIGPDFKAGSFGKTTNTATGRGTVGWAVDKATGATTTAANPGGNYQLMNAANVNKTILEAIGIDKATNERFFPNTDVLDFLKK